MGSHAIVVVVVTLKLLLRFDTAQQVSIAECQEHWDSTKAESIEYLSVI
jgi:hypothetical protein